jgi:hypothetical protein
LRRRHRIIRALPYKRQISVSTHRLTHQPKYECSPNSETWSNEWNDIKAFPLTRDNDFLSGVDLDTFCRQMDPIRQFRLLKQFQKSFVLTSRTAKMRPVWQTKHYESSGQMGTVYHSYCRSQAFSDPTQGASDV